VNVHVNRWIYCFLLLFQDVFSIRLDCSISCRLCFVLHPFHFLLNFWAHCHSRQYVACTSFSVCHVGGSGHLEDPGRWWTDMLHLERPDQCIEMSAGPHNRQQQTVNWLHFCKGLVDDGLSINQNNFYSASMQYVASELEVHDGRD